MVDESGQADWDERLGWAHGLIAEDPGARAVAIGQLLRAQDAVRLALERANEAMRSAYDLTEPQWLEARPGYLAVWQAYHDAQRYSLPGALWDRPRGDMASWPGLPYALLFLEWEATRPGEWGRYAKSWGTKERLIRDLAVPGHTEPVRAKLIDLVEAAVRRAYRCKDRGYVRVARVLDCPDLRARLERAAEADDPWSRLHAGYVLRLLDDPDLPNSRRVWRAWCAGTDA
ncbi:hypothetical protein [Glycomyces sp. NRRL B-16210]|uniref:hypothetical protein n=1 Tax=Glycomyces sp. NRRL B-16210 TaxID=1463821 RepID=UPI0004BEC5CE|nr:hypothetical protein [Glycomyces sp. NRRL B-16210]